MSTSKIVVSLREKDYHSASVAFVKLMQEKVNLVLMEARSSMLFEDDAEFIQQTKDHLADLRKQLAKTESASAKDRLGEAIAQAMKTLERYEGRNVTSGRKVNEAAPWATSGGSVPSQPYMMGQGAFHDGIKRAPALDKAFQQKYLKAGTPIGDKAYPDACSQWTKGWDDANLAPGSVFGEARLVEYGDTNPKAQPGDWKTQKKGVSLTTKDKRLNQPDYAYNNKPVKEAEGISGGIEAADKEDDMMEDSNSGSGKGGPVTPRQSELHSGAPQKSTTWNPDKKLGLQPVKAGFVGRLNRPEKV